MRSWTIAFSLGVILAGLLPRLPSLPMAIALLLCGIALHACKTSRLAGAFAAGLAWLCIYGQLNLQQRWPDLPAPRDVWVQGTVWNLPVTTERGQRFQFRMDQVCRAALLAACDFPQLPRDGRKVLLTLYEPLLIEPGQRWRWQLRLRPPHGFANPGGFDYEAWLMQQGIAATGYVREIPDDAALATNAAARLFERARLYFIRFIESADEGDLRYPQLLRALTVGDGSSISDEEWELFADTGTTHLLVISGSHVALICLWLYAIGYWLSSRSVAVLRRMPAPYCAALLALAGGWMYTGLAGFSLPALRALLMAGLMLLAILLRRHYLSINNLCLALAAILIIDPLAAQNPGFWLSFIAVAVLLHVGAPVHVVKENPAALWFSKAWQLLRHFFLLQWKLALALLPILLLYFQQTSLLAPFVNLLTIPLIGLLIVPLALSALLVGLAWPWAGAILLLLSDKLLHLNMLILQYSTMLLPANTLVLPALSMTGMALLAFTAIAAVWAPARWQRFAALAVLPLSLQLKAPALEEGSVRVTVLDAGQGLAVIVSTRDHHLLYDTGPRFSERFDAGSDVVVPALRHYNIAQLDAVVVSHADADHAGGLDGVIEEFASAHFLGSDISIFPATVVGERCREGQSWQWNGVSFHMLHPDDGPYDDNNGSCVLLIEAADQRLLLTGDIERKVEAQLLRRHADLSAQVVIAPHHGSRSSSSFPFVRQLAPAYVVYSSGYQNRFNHPAAEVVKRYEAEGSRGFMTAASGAISFEISATGGLAVTEQRRLRRRFWSAEPPE